MEECLCGCLTDLVSYMDESHKANQSRVDQIGREWIINLSPTPLKKKKYIYINIYLCILLVHDPAVLQL